jgi:hypothetical protein
MGSKFRFKLNGSEMIFDKKNDFINFCQKKYKESENGKLKSKASYSFNDGETWSDISLFKYYRQDIQNEKQPQNESRNYSEKGESKLDQSSGVPNWVLIILTPLILFGVYYYANQNNQNKVPRSENNTEIINIPSDTSNGINEEPIQNEVNSQAETDDNSTTNNSKLQQNSSNTIQCPSCDGLGHKIGCPRCNKGYIHCRSCYGNRYDNNGRVCLNCNGTGIVLCDYCGGSYSTFTKNCIHCDGKKILKLVLCTSCKGLVLNPGDEWYSNYGDGTHCLYCGADGYTQETIE